MEVGPFFSVVQTLIARRLGGWDRLEQRLEEAVNQDQAQQQAAKHGKKLPSKARVLSVEQARKMQADAQEYDAKVVKGGDFSSP